MKYAILFAALATTSQAQQWTPAVSTVAQAPILQRTIDIDLHDAPLKSALRVIADQTDGQLIYDGTVTAIGKRITIQARTATVNDVLRDVLAGTSVKIFVSSSGQLVLLKRVDAKAQTGTIHGTVTDAKTNEPLSDVQVGIPGTHHVYQTATDGRYTLTGIAPSTVTVRAQRIGYTAQELAATVTEGAPVQVDFALTRTAVSLEQVVVTAAGDEQRRTQGNSMSTVSFDEIKNAPVNNPQDLLDARVPGLTMLSNGGQPGSGGTIRLRGVNSVTLDNTPIIYVDGVRIYSPLVPAGPTLAGGSGGNQGYLPLNDINAADIDHVDVVSGPAATTLYGTEASGGVIRIFTKHGSNGPTVWDAQVTGGLNNMGHVGLSSDPTGEGLNECSGPNLINSAGQRWIDPSCPKSGSWLKTGDVGRYVASVRGGAERMNYYVSGNYNTEFGVLATGHNEDGGIRTNFAFLPTDRLTIGLTASFVTRKTRWGPDGDNSQGLLLNTSRGQSGNFVGGNGTTDCQNVPTNDVCVVNGYTFQSQNYSYENHFISGLTAEYRQSSAITHHFTLGYDFNANNHSTGVPWGFPGVEVGQLWIDQRQHYKLTAEYSGTWTTPIGHSLSSSFSWGGQAFRDVDQWSETFGTNFAGPGTPIITNAGSVQVLGDSNPSIVNAGLFVQEVFGVGDRLFVTGGIRVDGNSAFGSKFGLQPYPKVAAAYNLTKGIKFRAAYGESGRAPGPFDKLQTYTVVAAESLHAGFVPSQLGSPTLGPERTAEYEGGFDASAFDGRAGIEVTAYRARTTNALVGITQAPSLGFANTQLENVGTLQNEGLETHLTGGIIRTRDVSWDARLNLSWLSSRAIDLHGQSIYTFFRTYAQVGYPIPNYFGFAVLNPNAHADPIISDAPTHSLGAQYPDRLFGAGTTVTLFRHLSVDALVEAQYGGHLENDVAYRNEFRRVWRPCYPEQQAADKAAAGDPAALAPFTALQRAACSTDGAIADRSWWTQKTDFIKLRSVSVTYDIPHAWLGRTLRAASVSIQGRNLWMWTKYQGADPEIQDVVDAGAGALGRYDYYNFPTYRTWLATIRVTF
jgi:hypothetical protein